MKHRMRVGALEHVCNRADVIIWCIVTCLIWIHFLNWIVAAIACIRALCPGKIGCCKERTGHSVTVRIGSL